MIATMRSEFIKLRTVRSNITMAIALFVIPLAISLLSVTFMKATNIDSGTLPGYLLATGAVAVLLIGVIGVLSVTQEYSQGTIRLTLSATPNRTRVYAAKGAVVALLGAALMGLVVVVGTVVGSAILEARDIAGPHTDENTGAAFLAVISMGVLVALLGLAIGAITRNPPSAITTLVLWPLLVEGIVGGLLSVVFGGSARDWLPFQTGFNSTFLDVPDSVLGRWQGIGYFAAWVLAISVIAERSLKRRDA